MQRLTPEREKEFRKLCSLETREMLAEIDALRAGHIALKNDFIIVSSQISKERDELQAENQKLRSRIEKLKEALRRLTNQCAGTQHWIRLTNDFESATRVLAHDDEMEAK